MFFVLPVFVVIKITPFLPSVPYNVVAAKPLRISMFSILLGSISKDLLDPELPSTKSPEAFVSLL